MPKLEKRRFTTLQIWLLQHEMNTFGKVPREKELTISEWIELFPPSSILLTIDTYENGKCVINYYLDSKSYSIVNKNLLIS